MASGARAFWGECKKNNKGVVFLEVPTELLAKPTKKYQELFEPFKDKVCGWGEEPCTCVSCQLVDPDDLPDDEFTVLAIEGDPSQPELYNFVRYCTRYLDDKERSQRRSDRKKAADGKHSKSDCSQIATWQEFRCYFCFTKLYDQSNLNADDDLGSIAHWDHLTPLSRNGTNFPSNMALTCNACNLKKAYRTEREYWTLLRKEISAEEIDKIIQFHQSYRKQKLALDKPHRKKLANSRNRKVKDL